MRPPAVLLEWLDVINTMGTTPTTPRRIDILTTVSPAQYGYCLVSDRTEPGRMTLVKRPDAALERLCHALNTAADAGAGFDVPTHFGAELDGWRIEHNNDPDASPYAWVFTRTTTPPTVPPR